MSKELIMTIAIFLGVFLVGYSIGKETAEWAHFEPSPEECLNICVDEFERMGC